MYSTICFILQKKIKDKTQSEAITEECRKHDEEIMKTEKEKDELLSKISLIQKKILVGGENLFEKAQQQAFLLEASGVELETLDKSHQQLEEALQKKGAERIDVEEKYSSLQEEDVGITKKIKKVQQLLNEAKEEHADKEHEYQREMEALLDNYRLLVRELQLANLMIESYIPKEYLKKIEENMLWNTETTEYQMKGVAYTGNNMRKHMSNHLEHSASVRRGMKAVYHSYNSGKQRVRTSSVPRPNRHLIAPKSARQ